MTREEIAKILAYLSADTNTPVTPEKLTVWFDAFKHLDAGQAWAAAKIYLHRGMYAGPRVSEFSEVLEELAASKNGLPDSDQAFEQACMAVRRFGFYGPEHGLQSLHPVVREALQAIGWSEFCQSNNPPALRAHFKQAFEQAAKRTKRNSGMAPNLKLLLNNTTEKLEAA